MPKKPDARYSRTGDRAAVGVSSHTFRCSDEVWEAVQKKAADSGDNVSDVIRRALIAYANAPPRIAYSKQEAAACLGVSVDFLEAHVLGDLRVVREGRKVLIPVAELERWLAERAHRTLPSQNERSNP